MSSKKTRTPWRACAIALAVVGGSAQAQTEAPAASPPPAAVAADTPAASTPAPAAIDAANGTVAGPAPAPAAPQTRVRFEPGGFRPGFDRLRVVRREDTVGNVAGQVALSIAVSLLTRSTSVGASSFSKDDLAGSPIDELRKDPVVVNPSISELNDALSTIATRIYTQRAAEAYKTALTDGSTPEEIEEARKVQEEADTPLHPGPWHLVYENLAGTDELYRLRFGAELGRPGFMRPPAGCLYQSEPFTWTQWQADRWQRLREERARAVTHCTEALAAIPEKRW